MARVAGERRSRVTFQIDEYVAPTPGCGLGPRYIHSPWRAPGWPTRRRLNARGAPLSSTRVRIADHGARATKTGPHRHGSLVRMNRGASVDLPAGISASSLPQVCVVTGRPATGAMLVRAPAVWRMLLMGGLAYRFAGGSFVELPVSTEVVGAYRHDRRQGIALLLGALASALLFGSGAGAHRALLFMAGNLGLLLTLLIGVRMRRRQTRPGPMPKARRLRTGRIRVRGVHEAFARALGQRSYPPRPPD